MSLTNSVLIEVSFSLLFLSFSNLTVLFQIALFLNLMHTVARTDGKECIYTKIFTVGYKKRIFGKETIVCYKQMANNLSFFNQSLKRRDCLTKD